MSEGAARFARGVPLDNMSRLSYLVVRASTQFVHAVSSVESVANLLVSLDKAFKLSIQVSVLAIQNSTVMTKGLNLSMGIVVTSSESLVRESEFFLLTSGYCEVVFSITVLGFQVVEVSSEVSVATEFNLRPSSEVSLLSKLGIKLTSEFTLLLLKTSLFISSTAQVSLRVVKSLSSSTEIKVSGFSSLLKFSEFLLVLVERVVSRLDALGSISVLSFLHSI